MSSDRDTAESEPPEEDMLPDEREAIAERLDSLEDEDRHRTVAEVADDLGIGLEGNSD